MVFAPVHVAYHNPLWAVTVEHEAFPRSQHRTREAACDAARALAQRTHTDLVIHDYRGNIASSESFRNHRRF